ncbi:hypothetical protein CORC01_08215 [Colletotrichum orchidophilum]|uniref:Uncharacterized protein n=1 Tax=Colletotrichum orchidophilum TaxID=1209926 RepID=A0A1G4B5A0_9PEZI|nr:uncharacterized protein CORC01_08215 [Colletotrichum orchidophilum]OHE96452.1 hypothetical protein CORC01_08215 [Colletotrichum orchidophilum]
MQPTLEPADHHHHRPWADKLPFEHRHHQRSLSAAQSFDSIQLSFLTKPYGRVGIAGKRLPDLVEANPFPRPAQNSTSDVL